MQAHFGEKGEGFHFKQASLRVVEVAGLEAITVLSSTNMHTLLNVGVTGILDLVFLLPYQPFQVLTLTV